MKYKYTGKSMNDLYQEYGKGNHGFYSHWWEGETFANEKPETGVYEVELDEKAKGLTYNDQAKRLKKGWEVIHPAIVSELLLSHHKKTGKWLLHDWYARTSSLDSGGYRVSVGRCGYDSSVNVNGWYGSASGYVGLGASRKLRNLKAGKLETSCELESRVLELEQKFEKLSKALTH